MRKHERITNNVKADKSLLRKINEQGYGEEAENIDNFIMNAERYLKAIKERRMINVIATVSASGMSRTFKFNEVAKSGGCFNFYSLFVMLGHPKARGNNGYFSVRGCGMDMIFHTNYCNVRALKRLGFISSKQCSVLEQMTPTTI
tara:strand:+ start:413 stop:847 length:435 start_codon:yes stop_codon:yes gene_type:complete